MKRDTPEISRRIFEGFHEEGRECVFSSDLSRLQPDLRARRERGLSSTGPRPCSSEFLVPALRPTRRLPSQQ